MLDPLSIQKNCAKPSGCMQHNLSLRPRTKLDSVSIKRPTTSSTQQKQHFVAIMMHPSRRAYVEEADTEVSSKSPVSTSGSQQLNSTDRGQADPRRRLQDRGGIDLDSVRKFHIPVFRLYGAVPDTGYSPRPRL